MKFCVSSIFFYFLALKPASMMGVDAQIQARDFVLSSLLVLYGVPFANAATQTLKIIGTDVAAGGIDPYSEGSTVSSNGPWGPTYSVGWHPWQDWGGVIAPNWVNTYNSPFLGLHAVSWIRIRFTMPMEFTGATMKLKMKADNKGEVAFNGKKVATIVSKKNFNFNAEKTKAFLKPGMNEITMKLTDWGGWVAYQYNIEITFDAEEGGILLPVDNEAPDLDVIPPLASLEIGSKVNLVGTCSDNDGDSLVITYNWGDGTAPKTFSGIDAEQCVIDGSHTYSTVGTHTLTVEIADEHGAIDSFDHTFTVTSTSTAPSSSPSSNPSAASAAPSSSPSTAPSSSPSTAPSSSPTFESISHDLCKIFAVHARTTVTFDGVKSTIHNGDVSVYPGTSITGDFKFNNEGNATGAFQFEIGEVVKNSESFASLVLVAHGVAMAAHGNDEKNMDIEIGGLTFIPGTYRSDSAINFAHGTVVTLDGGNEPNPEFIFIAGSTLVTAADTYFNLINGAKAENVLWALGTAATLGARSVVEGSIMAGTAITFGTNSELHGCALAQSAVTFESEGSVVLNHYEADGIYNALIGI
jgi:hypothetical protein